MQWHLGICKAFANFALLALLPLPAQAVDTARLWLPKIYQKYYLQLVDAAEAAEALDRCQTVLEGTIDREQSLPAHPHFRILCRQANGLSYNEMVDGLSFATLTTLVVELPEPTEEERERLRQLEQARAEVALAARTEQAWQVCDAQIQQQTRLMVDMVRQVQGQPEATEVNDREITFTVAFDAKNLWGEALRYQALCTVGPESSAVVELRKRSSE